jgi:hypothetical protein
MRAFAFGLAMNQPLSPVRGEGGADLMSRKSTSRGWPAIIVIAVAAAAASLLFSRLITPQGLVDVSWSRVMYVSLTGAVVVAICGVGSLLFYRNIHAPQTAVNFGLFVILAASVVASFGAVTWQKSAQAAARTAVLPVFTAVRTDIDRLDRAYVDTAASLGVPDFVEPENLARGFNPVKVRGALKTVREGHIRHHAEVQDRIAQGRARLEALKLGSREKNALASYHLEFSYKGAGPAQLKAYETYELDLLDYEVDFLAKNAGRWRVQGDGLAFASSGLVQQYRGIAGPRRGNARYLARLREFNTEQVGDTSF